jgi:hypothetical protein
VSLNPAVLNLPGALQFRPVYDPFRVLVASDPGAILIVTAPARTDMLGIYSTFPIYSILTDGLTYLIIGTASSVNEALHGALLTPAPCKCQYGTNRLRAQCHEDVQQPICPPPHGASPTRSNGFSTAPRGRLPLPSRGHANKGPS